MTDPSSPAARDAQQPLLRLMASDVMTSDVVTALTTTTVGEAMRLMRTLGIRHLPVLEDGRFVGLVDDRLVALSLLTAGGAAEALERPVSTAMSQYVPQIAPGEPLQRVAHLLRSSRCDAIVVIDAQEHLLGIVTMVDVVTAVALGSAGQPPTPSVATRPPPATAPPAIPDAARGARS